MRSVSNILIVNLSVADLVVSLVNMPAKIAQIYIGRTWLFGGTVGFVFCKIMNLVPFLAVFVSTQSFAVLALDRFLAVFFPLRKPITTKVAYVLVGLVWVSSVGFYYVYCHSATLMDYGSVIKCTTDPNIVFGGLRGFKIFIWIEFTVVVLIPLVISFVLYTATMVRLWTRRVPGNAISSNASYTERVNRKVLKMLLYM
ncbi:hypothetical protein QZH41_004120 [Actinostola sp. cb2023]|nr:hypothetical protein QZH41_004120 [Actinostola sp. cb2023]